MTVTLELQPYQVTLVLHALREQAHVQKQTIEAIEASDSAVRDHALHRAREHGDKIRHTIHMIEQQSGGATHADD